MTEESQKVAIRDQAIRACKEFLVFHSPEFLGPISEYSDTVHPCGSCFISAVEGLHSVISSAGLPFRLIQDSVYQRQFDRVFASESILALIPEEAGKGLSEEGRRLAHKSAKLKMEGYSTSNQMRDQIVQEMVQRLESTDVRVAAQELLVQTLISTWSIFESFGRSFIIEWLNDDPERASAILTSPDLKEFIGKKAVDLETISNHGFDLTKSMGTVLFKDRRLDSLANIRGAMKALFGASNLQVALGGELWLLNQRRHLFVHNRGVVDEMYLKVSADTPPLGKRLALSSEDVIQHLYAVRSAILAIGDAAKDKLAAKQ